MKVKISPFALLVAGLAFAAGIGSAQAQDETGLMNARIVTVKQDHVNDWIELQKQLSESMKKASAPGRRIYEQVKGDHNTFHVITELDEWGDYDSPNDNGMDEAEWANWLNKITDTVQSRRELTYRTFDSLRIETDTGEPSKYVALRKHTIKRGSAGEYRSWLSDKLYPTMKKLGIKGRSFGQVILGDNVDSFYHVRGLDSYADMGVNGLSRN
jgi:NADH:ubiquinone oxidoreductase subunit